MADVQLDETSCGPLCQHPQCWASNRRVERGLPRLEALTGSKDEATFEYDGLPTVKVQNILDDYGFSGTDVYPSIYQVASLGTTDTSNLPNRQRSASAPSITLDKSLNIIHSSKTPRARGGQSRRDRNPSRPPLLKPIQQSFPPKLSKVHLNQICGPVTPSDEVRMGSPIYLWQPSEKSLRSIDTPVTKTDSKPIVILPKDITEDLIPEKIADQERSRKKMKSKRSTQIPTGGRPYTHPLKTPPPIVRRTLPADMDNGIAQLLSFPRDVFLQILEHTQESDLFDKEKVQALLARVMPHIRFNGSRRLTTKLESRPPPLHAMGLLRNQKMPILEGILKFEKSEVPLKSLPRMPLVLDRSEVTRPYKGSGDEERTQHEHPRIFGGMPDLSHLLKNKMTSVSARSLPPLLPGSQVTKPFHYTIQSLDLALTPLLTPENPPSSPCSENVSTLYVTLPSDDHSLLSTAKYPHLAVMRQESPASSHHSHGSQNQVPSYATYMGPYNASGPYGSPGPFNTPHGTPLSYSSIGPIPSQADRLGSGSTVRGGTLQTIHEWPAATPDTVVAAASPSMKQPWSVSPWEAQRRHSSRALSAPNNPSSEVWPVVDEKSYLHSAENVDPEKPEKDIPETVAPPPSPAPSVCSGLLEEDTVSKDSAIIQKVMDCNQGAESDGVNHVTQVTTEGSTLTDGDTQKRALSAIEEDAAGRSLKDGETDLVRSGGSRIEADTSDIVRDKVLSDPVKAESNKVVQEGENNLVESEASRVEADITVERASLNEQDQSDTVVNECGQIQITIEVNRGNQQNRGLTSIGEIESNQIITKGEREMTKIEGGKHLDDNDTQKRKL